MAKSFLSAIMLFSCIFFIANSSKAQQFKDYYIEFSSDINKKDIKSLLVVLKSKKEVSNFQLFHGDHYFCVLKATTTISESLFKSWLGNINYKVINYKQETISTKLIEQKVKTRKLKATPKF